MRNGADRRTDEVRVRLARACATSAGGGPRKLGLQELE
jgi:hypothetical protein